MSSASRYTPRHLRAEEDQARLPTLKQTRTRLAYLARFVRPHKRDFIISVTCATLNVVAAMTVPTLMKHAIDNGIDSGNDDALTFWVSMGLAAIVLAAIFQYVNMRFTIWSYRVLGDLRTALFSHVQKQGIDFFERNRTGTVISRLTNDVDALESLVHDGVFMVFVNVITLLTIEGFMFALDWRLALAVNVIFPFMIIATIFFRKYSARAYKKTRERMALVTAYLAESIGGMRVIQAFAAEERSAREFDATNEHYRRANMDTIWLSASYFPFTELLATVGTAVVLWYGGILTEDNLIEAGVLFAFIAYLDNFFDPVQQLSQFYGNFLSAMAALDKIMDVMETEPTIQDDPSALELDTVRGDVTFDHVSFSYGRKRDDLPDVLHDVDVQVRAGETIALVGHTGAGKSTFVKLLCRFYDPSEGRVLLDGHDLRDLRASWLRRSLGIVPQEGFLFSATVRDNIRYGLPDAPHEQVEAAARAVGAHEFITELEEGYDTELGERGGRLSAGQRQLIAFARAMLADPALLVLDEATSSVDVATELRLSAGLHALVAGRTAFIVAHRLSTIRGADRILVIDDGRVIEQGTHDELLEKGGHFASLYGSWTGHERTVDECLEPQDA